MNNSFYRLYRSFLIAQYLFFIYGIIWLGWSIMFVIFAFWLESLVNLVCTLIKISLVKCTGKGPVLLRFGFSFTFILLMHGVFILILASMLDKTLFIQLIISITNVDVTDPQLLPIIQAFRSQVYNVLFVIMLRYAAHHGVDYIYLRKQNIGSCKNIPIAYRSVIYVHFFIIAGFFVAVYLGAPQYFTIVFVLIKILFDWFDVGAKALKMKAVIK